MKGFCHHCGIYWDDLPLDANIAHHWSGGCVTAAQANNGYQFNHKPVAFEGLRSKLAANLDLCLLGIVFLGVLIYGVWLVQS